MIERTENKLYDKSAGVEFIHVGAGYDGRQVLRDISFTARPGEITTLMGPNGCGKTTLLRTAAGQLPLLDGEIKLNGRQVSEYERRELARHAAFMPQVRNVPAITVQDLVMNGRFPYLGLSRQLKAADREAVEKAMQETGVTAWADRDLRELSGGERQRVYIAMVLAQDTDIIFMDEPSTYLDLGHQFELLEMIRNLAEKGKTVVLILHDLAQALSVSSRLALIDHGQLLCFGTPDQILKDGQIEKVFQVKAHEDQGNYYFTAP